MSLIPKAIELAFSAHAGQTRDEGTPYVEHPLRVWESFKAHRPLGETPIRRYEELGCVAILHDVLEDCDVTYEDLAYYAALREAPLDIQLIKLLDRLDNLAGLGTSPVPGKVARYIEETERVFLPWAEAVSPRICREMRMHLGDLREGLAASN